MLKTSSEMSASLKVFFMDGSPVVKIGPLTTYFSLDKKKQALFLNLWDIMEKNQARNPGGQLLMGSVTIELTLLVEHYARTRKPVRPPNNVYKLLFNSKL